MTNIANEQQMRQDRRRWPWQLWFPSSSHMTGLSTRIPSEDGSLSRQTSRSTGSGWPRMCSVTMSLLSASSSIMGAGYRELGRKTIQKSLPMKRKAFQREFCVRRGATRAAAYRTRSNERYVVRSSGHATSTQRSVDARWTGNPESECVVQ